MKQPTDVFRYVIPAFFIFFLFLQSLHAQLFRGEYPELEEIEGEHGYLRLDEEQLSALALAELQQEVVEQDSDGFVESFSEDYQEEGKGIPLPLIREFMWHFFRVMNERPIYMLPDSTPALGHGITGTFDFGIRDVHLRKTENYVVADFKIIFHALFQPGRPERPFSAPVRLVLHKNRKRWRIYRSSGMFPFFARCMQLVNPGKGLPERFSYLLDESEKENAYEGRVVR